MRINALVERIFAFNLPNDGVFIAVADRMKFKHRSLLFGGSFLCCNGNFCVCLFVMGASR